MAKLAANLSTMFREVRLLERFGKARAAGFQAVEMQFPYAEPAEEIARALRETRLALVLMNAPAGNVDAGDRGLALDETARFQDSIRTAVEYARVTACMRIHVLVGKTRSGLFGASLKRVVEHLRYAAGQFDKYGIELQLEALNRHDHPAYAVPTLQLAEHLRRALAVSNARLLFDVYHVQRMGADVLESLHEFMRSIGHVQISGVPDRAEPDPDQTRRLFDALDAYGYGGFVGCEYNPRHETFAGLGWARQYGVRPAAS